MSVSYRVRKMSSILVFAKLFSSTRLSRGSSRGADEIKQMNDLKLDDAADSIEYQNKPDTIFSETL